MDRLLNTCSPLLLNTIYSRKKSSKIEYQPLEGSDIYLTCSLCLEWPSVSICWILLNAYAIVKQQTDMFQGHFCLSVSKTEARL